MSQAVAVIPARWASSRFEGKALALLKGKEIILRVVEQAKKCKRIDEVVVATDDQRIFDCVTNAGYKAQMTSLKHCSGTERIAEVAEKLDVNIVVNIQGDEPMIDPESVDAAVEALQNDPALNISTLAFPITDDAEFESRDVVKVITDKNRMALYFSRLPIPFDRGEVEVLERLKHLGLYAYRRDFLLKIAKMEPTELERSESLEQLRILQNGYGIKVVMASRDSIGIDTPKDLEEAEALFDA